jgi:hypothetical protein
MFLPDQIANGKQGRNRTCQQQSFNSRHIMLRYHIDRERRNRVQQQGREHLPEAHCATIVLAFIRGLNIHLSKRSSLCDHCFNLSFCLLVF